ncbi:hypothetical protein [Alkalibaculum bacchi]|uniref:hypothetical protein n=1 Tax=Alkalibaculum bacchi TaxID=645887 RepID=UPI0026EDF04C|nr:hypothetical protein [Alkalibaculum bacchi]
MKKIIWYIIVLVLTFIIVACTTQEVPENDKEDTQNQQEQKDQDDQNDIDKEQPSQDLDLQIEEFIEIEGMKEKITLNLYDKGIIPFRTYIPSDFTTEEVSNGEGDAYWFYANYGNKKIDDVYFKLYFFSEITEEEPNLDDKDNTFSLMLDGMKTVNTKEKRYGWSIKEFKSPEEPRYAILGKHKDQYFVMILDYPVEYAEGFVPRVNKILEHFYWTDTQEYLSL